MIMPSIYRVCKSKTEILKGFTNCFSRQTHVIGATKLVTILLNGTRSTHMELEELMSNFNGKC